MTTVKIKQDKDSGVLTINARLGGSTRRLIRDVEVSFDVEEGTRYLTLNMISSSTADTKYRLDFTNAERPNGDKFVEDIGNHGHAPSLRLHVPGVQ